MRGVASEKRALRGWAIAAAVSFTAAVAAVLCCIFGGAFDFEPISRPMPGAEDEICESEEVSQWS